jgi:4-alpha-glucanotransferase
LRLASLFQVMRARWSGEEREHDRGWLGRCPYASSEAVAQFAEQHREEVAFLTWMQWVADVHLRMAAKACADSGMSIGIYRDLAVGCDRSGAETWSEPLSFIQGVSVGAPPDILNPAGQNWGLPPFNPVMLRRQGYRPLRDLIRANMRHAGGLRIDHVMGLQRLYCIPDGRSASEGAYIEYPLDDMLGIIALESHRNQCIVVGEDLGTVPAGFRERLEAANVLSYRVLMFEQDADGFILPENYPEKAVAVAGSHDMATLTGWHAGTDIALKEQLGLYPDAGEVTRQRRQRESERCALEQLLFGKTARPTAAEFSDAMHRFLGRTRAFLAIAQLDDLIAEAEPVNVPGTVDHPNWRRKYNQPLEALSDDHRAWQQLGAFRPSTA